MVTRSLVVLAVAAALFFGFVAVREAPPPLSRIAGHADAAPTAHAEAAAPIADDGFLARGAVATDGARTAYVAPRDACRLVVRVVERTTRAPLERALVELAARSARRAEYTDADGRVAFDDLPEGPAQVWIDARGAPMGTMRLHEPAGDDGGYVTGGWARAVVLVPRDPASAAAGDAPNEVELELVALVTVRGRATLDGRPLAGSTVFAVALAGDTVAVDPVATVADDGSFELTGVAVGPVAFRVEPPSEAQRVGTVHADLPPREHSVPPGEQHEVQLAWSTADHARVRGRAVDAAGRPLAGVGVALMRLDTRPAGNGAATGEDPVVGLDSARVMELLAGPAPRLADPSEIGFADRTALPAPFPPDVDLTFEGDPEHPTVFLSTDRDGRFEFAVLAPGTWRLDVEAHHPEQELLRALVREAPWVAYETSVCGIVDTRAAQVWDVGDVVVPRLELVRVTGRVDVHGVPHDRLLPGTYSLLGASFEISSAGVLVAPVAGATTRADVSRRDHTYTWLGVLVGSVVRLDLWGPLPAHRRPGDGSPLARIELSATAFESRDGVLTAHQDFVVEAP